MMDPLHITEFASDEYFKKLHQQREHQQQQQQQGQQNVQHADASAPLPVAPQLQGSQFILPLREAKPIETEEVQTQQTEPIKKKSRFGLSKFLHSSKEKAPVIPQVVPEDTSQSRLSVGGTTIKPRIKPFDELFIGLPAELQIQVIASLPLSDVLNLRLSSKAWHVLVTANEGPIVRYHLEKHIPAYAKRLYPPPDDPLKVDFHYLCGLWHRLHVAAKLAYFICEWATKELFLRNTEQQKLEFAPQRERMRRRLIPLIFTIFHFFETYRAKHVEYLHKNNGRGLSQTPYTLNPIEVEIMSGYDDRTLLQVHQVFPLIISSFCRRLRPPSYVGRAERAIRGYLRDRPTDEVHVATLCVGGLRQVERFWEVKGYNARIGVVDNWYQSITKEPVDSSSGSKPRRGFMGLGRKKSTVDFREATTSSSSHQGRERGSSDVRSTRRNSGLVFNTSLAAGMPMGPLSRDSLRLILADLPILQRFWLTTAEALILDRKIVERASDIRRNAQVMVDLIQEDGMGEEDDWWYGQAAQESLRPPQESMEEDPDAIMPVITPGMNGVPMVPPLPG